MKWRLSWKVLDGSISFREVNEKIPAKISILVALDVLDSPLSEIKIGKLNKQHISETELLNKYFVEIYLKMTQ